MGICTRDGAPDCKCSGCRDARKIEALRADGGRARAEVTRLQGEVARLQARLDDYYDDHRAVVAGKCAPDEVHCSCVPHLRREVEAMRAVVDAARAIDGIRNGDVTEEMRAISAALRALDALRTRKGGG